MTKFVSLIAATALAFCFVISSTKASPLIENLTTYEVELPVNLSGRFSNWRVWTFGWLTTRLFQGMDAEKNVYIGCTSSDEDGYVFKVKYNGNKIVYQRKFEGLHIRGMYVHHDGSYGVLLWNRKTTNIYIAKIGSDDKEVWRVQPYEGCTNTDDFEIGDSRLEYGNGWYYAYYHVHGISCAVKGHEGDAYYKVSDQGKLENVWYWGCSHPMSNLLRYHRGSTAILAVCTSDAYPGYGVYTEDKNYVYNVPANKAGKVAGEIGGLEIAYGGRWILIFNGLQPERKDSSYSSSTDNQDIAVAFIGRDKKRQSVKFLTDTKEINEEDGCISLMPGTFGNNAQYLVGWKSGSDYLLSVIDANANFVVNPVSAGNYTKWGARDDSFRTYEDDKSVYWLYAPDSSGNKVVITRFGEPIPSPEVPSSSSGISSSHESSSSTLIPFLESSSISVPFIKSSSSLIDGSEGSRSFKAGSGGKEEEDSSSQNRADLPKPLSFLSILFDFFHFMVIF